MRMLKVCRASCLQKTDFVFKTVRKFLGRNAIV